MGAPRRDYHTIYKLVYHDLQGALQREAAAHLTAEGERAYAAFAAECPDGPPGIALKARLLVSQNQGIVDS